MPHRRVVGYSTHIPRNQARTTGKQEGTLPKKLKGKKKMNINDEMLRWKNILDTGSIVAVREAAVEILAKLRRTVEQGVPVESETPDLTASHYLEVCATVDRLRETLGECEEIKRKTVPVALLRQIVGRAS